MTNKKISEINKKIKRLVKVFNNESLLFRVRLDYRHIHKKENDLCLTFFNRKTHNNSCINLYTFHKDEELEDRFKVCEILLTSYTQNDNLVQEFIDNKYYMIEDIERMLR